MPGPSRPTRALQRLLARSGRGRLAGAWAVGYVVAARVVGRYLAGGPDRASVYVRGSVGTSDVVPAVSDVDLVILVEGEPDRARVHRRWERLRRRLPIVTHLVDRPRVHPVGELAELLGRTAYTHGLDGHGTDGGRNPAGELDRGRALERPGLYGDTDGWRLVAGRDRRPPASPRDAQQERLAAWLELVFYWKRAFEAVADPTPPHTAALCVKLVAEPARALLWLADGERPASRKEAIERVAQQLPGEESRLAAVLELERRLGRMPAPPLELVLPLLERISSLIAVEVERQVAPHGTSSVELVGAVDGDRLPLCDWRALARPSVGPESFVPGGGPPGDLESLRRALAAESESTFASLRADDIVVFPSARRERSAMRAVACAVTDPVSFALLRGVREATFPEVAGWSARDWARRALAEQRSRLRAAGRATAYELVAAARATLFHESIRAGEPLLMLTPAATLALLADHVPAARGAANEVAESLLAGTAPAPAALTALRKTLVELCSTTSGETGPAERASRA